MASSGKQCSDGETKHPRLARFVWEGILATTIVYLASSIGIFGVSFVGGVVMSVASGITFSPRTEQAIEIIGICLLVALWLLPGITGMIVLDLVATSHKTKARLYENAAKGVYFGYALLWIVGFLLVPEGEGKPFAEAFGHGITVSTLTGFVAFLWCRSQYRRRLIGTT